MTHSTYFFCFIRNIFQSSRLYIKGILGGRPASLCLVDSGNVSFFVKFQIRPDKFCHDNSIGSWIRLIGKSVFCSTKTRVFNLKKCNFVVIVDVTLCKNTKLTQRQCPPPLIAIAIKRLIFLNKKLTDYNIITILKR